MNSAITTAAPTGSTRALLAGLVDYAGLFPPAALAMPPAVANFARYQRDEFAWMLGRFVCPAARLAEFSAALPASARAWNLSALVGADFAADLALIKTFNEREAGRAVVDVVEVKTETPEAITRLSALLPASLTAYCEIPVTNDPRELIAALAAHGLRAKVRAGGVTVAAFPDAAQVARFIVRCAEAGNAFKATAGLHHPLRGEFNLTYEPGCARATMHGFLSLFLAAAFARAGWTAERLVPLLEETDGSAFDFTESAARWRGHALPAAEIENTRRQFAIAFGSCSFEEPVQDLKTLSLL